MLFDIYSRKSLFTGKGESIENQVEICKKYIFSNFPDTSEKDVFVFEDEGYSGKNMDRPQYKAMRNHQKKTKVDYVVVYRLDRISRNVGDFSNMMDDLKKNGIGFISVNERFDTSNPMGRAMITIAAVFAQLERETIAERVKDNMYMLARSGRWMGGSPPLGYKTVICSDVSNDPTVSKKNPVKFLQQTDNIEDAKLMFSIFLKHHSISRVSKDFIEKGIKTKNNMPYTLLGIKDILTNPVYCIADQDSYQYFLKCGSQVCFTPEECDGKSGLIAYGRRNSKSDGSPVRNDRSDWVIAIGKHQGILTGEEWIKAQNIIDDNKLSSTNRNKQKNNNALLSGMIICHKCGSRMFAKNRSNSETKFDYICGNKMKSGSRLCNCKNLNGIDTDKGICDYVLKFSEDKSLIRHNLSDVATPLNSQKETTSEQLKKKESQIAKKKKEIDNLIQSIQDADSLNTAFIHTINDKVSFIQSEISKLENEIIDLEERQKDQQRDSDNLDILLENLNSFKKTFGISSVAQKRMALRNIIDKIEWDGESLDIFI